MARSSKIVPNQDKFPVSTLAHAARLNRPVLRFRSVFWLYSCQKVRTLRTGEYKSQRGISGLSIKDRGTLPATEGINSGLRISTCEILVSKKDFLFIKNLTIIYKQIFLNE
jgi:hypothetical protein